MKEYLSFEGLSHFFNKLLSKIESTYAKSSDLTSPIARITQNESDIDSLETQVNQKVPTSRTINGKALTQNITLSASDVGADASGTAQTKVDAALSSAKSYTDTKIADLVDSAPDTLNTLNELAVAIQENDDVVDALNSAVGNKVDKVEGMGLSTNDYTDADKALVDGINDLHLIARTGSWNDLDDKPFYDNGLNITWDGNADGLVQSQGTIDYYYKVSSLVLTKNDVLNSIVYSVQPNGVEDSGQSVTEDKITEYDNGVLVLFGLIAIVPNDNLEIAPSSSANALFSEKGIYFMSMSVFGAYTKALIKQGDAKQLDEKYIPDTISRVEDLHIVATTGSWNDIENKKLTVTDDGNGNVTISL